MQYLIITLIITIKCEQDSQYKVMEKTNYSVDYKQTLSASQNKQLLVRPYKNSTTSLPPYPFTHYLLHFKLIHLFYHILEGKSATRLWMVRHHLGLWWLNFGHAMSISVPLQAKSLVTIFAVLIVDITRIHGLEILVTLDVENLVFVLMEVNQLDREMLTTSPWWRSICSRLIHIVRYFKTSSIGLCCVSLIAEEEMKRKRARPRGGAKNEIIDSETIGKKSIEIERNVPDI